MTVKEAAIVNQCYAVLTDECEGQKYKALERLAKLLARIVVRNVRAGQAGRGDRQGSEL